MNSSPAIGSDGTVYVGSWDKKLYAINGKTGDKLWEFETRCISSRHRLGWHGVRRVTGQSSMPSMAKRGQAMGICNGALNPPAIGSDGTVYVGSYDKKLYAINGKTGRNYGNLKTGGCLLPAIGSDGTVYVGSEDNKLYAINGKTGRSYGNLKRGMSDSSPPSALMARCTFRQMTRNSMPSMARLGQAMGI